MYNKDFIKLAQKELTKQTGIPIKETGKVDEDTLNALLFIEQIPVDWSGKRQVIGYIQYFCATEGINAGPIDGWYGPQTEEGYEQLVTLLSGEKIQPWRDEETLTGTDLLVKEKFPLQTQEELIKFYGSMGRNQTMVKVPYPLRLAWNKAQKITKFSCHEKVADSIVRILTRVEDFYGDKIIELGLDLWGGCLNVRKMRGGTKWSTHSWGISIDWDPEGNQLRRDRREATFAKPEYDEWWDLWEEEGWVSYGRAKNFDWMHVQAANVWK